MPARPSQRRRAPARRTLPRRVYWQRRLLVLAALTAVVLGTVVGIERLWQLRPDTGAVTAGPEQAQQVAGSPTPTVSGVPAATGSAQPPAPSAAEPDGSCPDTDVVVTPAVREANAGGEVRIVLEVGTVQSPACTFEVSAESVFLRITDDEGLVWSSQQCPRAVPTQDVVARSDRVTKVEVLWSGRRSDEGCTPYAAWVLPGVLTATAVARGSVTPVDTGFVLGPAVAPTVTVTPTPTPTPTPTRDR